jgi:hypothetical protein
MSNRAIIAIQVGHYANHVGAHFWNMQEANFVFDPKQSPANDVCHDVLYREGETIRGEITYTPRLVCVDLKGSLGLLPELGDLYGKPEVPKTDSIFWDGGAQVQKEEPKQMNDFQRELAEAEEAGGDEDTDKCEDKSAASSSKEVPIYDLKNQVDVWSDFLRSRFHHRTNVILNEYQHRNTVKPFDIYGLGADAWKEGGGEEIEDSLRSFAEEADSLQGFQLLSDNFDAFGGLGSSLVNLLADEYASKCTVAFTTSPPAYAEYSAAANSSRFLNTVLTADAFADCSAVSIVTPLSLAADTFVLPGGQTRDFSQLTYSPDSNYHTSAILAAAYDNVTMPWRSTSRKQVGMTEIPAALGVSGRRVAALELCAPFANADEYLVNLLNESDVETVSLCPSSKSGDVCVQAVSVCGVHESRWKPKDFRRSEKYAKHPYLTCDTAEEAFRHYYRLRLPRTQTGVATSPAWCSTANPFPRILKENTKSGEAQKMATLTSWQSSNSAAGYVQSLCDRAGKINLHKLHRFQESGLEQDELKCVVDRLSDVSENYRETHM